MPRGSAVQAPTPVNVHVTTGPEPVAVGAKPAEQSTELPPNHFWDLLQEIKPEEWGKVYDVMITRLEPKVGMQPGMKGFLDLVAEPINPSYIKQRYGGGKFLCSLQKNGRWKTSHQFDIEGAPKYDLTREAPPAAGVGASGDGSAAFQREFISVLREELARSREATTGGNSAHDSAISVMATAAEKAMDVVTKRMPQESNPTQQLESLVTTAKNLGIIGPQQGGGSALTDKLLTAMVERLLQPQQDMLTQFTAFLTIFEKLDALRGEGGTSKSHDWKAEGLSMLREHLPSILDTVAGNREAQVRIAEDRRRMMEAAAASRRGPAPGPGPAPAEIPARATAPFIESSRPSAMLSPLRTVPINSGKPEPEATVRVAPAATDRPRTERAAFMETPEGIDWLKNLMVKLIEDGEEAAYIVDVLDAEKPGFTDDLVAAPPEEITTLLRMDPILRAAVENPRWPELLREARAYILDVEEETEGAQAPVN